MITVAYLTDGRDWSYGIASALAKAPKAGWSLEKIFVKKDPPYPIQELGIPTQAIDPIDVKAMHREGAFDPYKVILVYGWSWILPVEIVQKKCCICNHPSPLPKYRGGTPLQNQILAGETMSSVSLFRMQKGIDDGPIYLQKEFSLEGHLREILARMETVGTEITIQLLEGLAQGSLTPTSQDETQATRNKRRKPEDSELKTDQLQNASTKFLWNFIRMLEDPYPNAYVSLADGSCLLLKWVEREFEPKPSDQTLAFEQLSAFTRDDLIARFKKRTVLRCPDGGRLLLSQWELNPRGDQVLPHRLIP